MLMTSVFMLFSSGVDGNRVCWEKQKSTSS